MTDILDTIMRASHTPAPMPLEPCPPEKNERAWELEEIAVRAKRLAAAIEKTEKWMSLIVIDPDYPSISVNNANAVLAKFVQHRDRCQANFEHALWYSAYGKIAP